VIEMYGVVMWILGAICLFGIFIFGVRLFGIVKELLIKVRGRRDGMPKM